MNLSFSPTSTNQKSFVLGVVAGMRTTVAPSLLADHLVNSPSFLLEGSGLDLLQKPDVATGIKMLVVAELIGDKLPKAPNRTTPLQLFPRVFSGAMVGSIIAEANGENKITGGLLGVAGALASTYAFFYLRKNLGKMLHLPNTALGLIEDAVALKLGTAILNR